MACVNLNRGLFSHVLPRNQVVQFQRGRVSCVCRSLEVSAKMCTTDESKVKEELHKSLQLSDIISDSDAIREERNEPLLGQASYSFTEPADDLSSGPCTSESTSFLPSWMKNFADNISPRVRGLVLLNILTLLYGSNISVVKESQLSLDPAGFAAGRFAIASLAFLPFLQSALKDPVIRRIGLELGFWGALGYLTQSEGIVTTPAGRAAFISSFTVIEVPIIAGLFGAKIPKVTWLAAAAAVCGIALLETPGGTSSLRGDIFTFASALFFGIHIMRSEHHSHSISKEAGLPMIALQLTTMAAVSGLWVLASGKAEVPGFGHWQEWRQVFVAAMDWPWLPMVYTGLISTALCLWIEIVSLKDVSATEAAMVYSLEPLYGAGFAWVLLGERWGLKGWVGASLILAGSLAMQLSGGKKSVSEPIVAQQLFSESKSQSAIYVLLAMAVIMFTIPGSELAAEESTQVLSAVDSLDFDMLANMFRIGAFFSWEMDVDAGSVPLL